MESVRTSNYVHTQEPHFHRTSHRASANLKIRTAQEPHLRKNEIVELCEAFHLRTGEVRIHSQQSLMPMLPLSEALPSLNGMSNVSHGLPHLVRSLAYMATERSIFFDISRTFNFKAIALKSIKFFGSFFQERTPSYTPRKPS